MSEKYHHSGISDELQSMRHRQEGTKMSNLDTFPNGKRYKPGPDETLVYITENLFAKRGIRKTRIKKESKRKRVFSNEFFYDDY